MDAWRTFLEAHAAVLRPLERELEAECALPLTWYDVLLQINAAPGKRPRMQQLARAVLLSKSRITRLVDSMETAGLVRRDACPEDKRGAQVALTLEGQRRLRAAAPIHLRGIAEHFSQHLTPDEAATLAAALAKVVLANAGGEPAS